MEPCPKRFIAENALRLVRLVKNSSSSNDFDVSVKPTASSFSARLLLNYRRKEPVQIRHINGSMAGFREMGRGSARKLRRRY